MVEWTNAFGNMKGKLDAIKPKNKEHKRQLKKLRKWETSNDIINIYKDISRNRKLIQQEIKETAFGPNSTIIHEDNLIKVLKNMFPYFQLTNTQWRMIVEIGDKDTQGFVNFETFIKLVENCARREEMPRMNTALVIISICIKYRVIILSKGIYHIPHPDVRFIIDM